MYPRSGFWYRGTSEYTLVPVFGTGEHPAKTTLLETTLCEPPKNWLTDPPLAVQDP